MYIFSIFLLYVVSLLPVIRANGTSCDEDELNLALCHAAFRVRLPSDMEIQASQDSRWGLQGSVVHIGQLVLLLTCLQFF